jgi:hypothetical protein
VPATTGFSSEGRQLRVSSAIPGGIRQEHRGLRCLASRHPALGRQADRTPSAHHRRVADGIRMIPISTPKGDFRVWTQRVGENPVRRGSRKGSSTVCYC